MQERLADIDTYLSPLEWPRSRHLVRYDPADEAIRRPDRVLVGSLVDRAIFDWIMSR